MNRITITDRKTGATERQVVPDPVGIDYRSLAAELARIWAEGKENVAFEFEDHKFQRDRAF